jgi:hypothetical protein
LATVDDPKYCVFTLLNGLQTGQKYAPEPQFSMGVPDRRTFEKGLKRESV